MAHGPHTERQSRLKHSSRKAFLINKGSLAAQPGKKTAMVNATNPQASHAANHAAAGQVSD